MAVDGSPSIGKLKKLYYSSGGLSSPTWVEQGKLEGGTLSRSRDVAEIKERSLDETIVLVGHIATGYTMTLTRRVGDSFYNAVEDAFNDGTNLALALMTGVITNAGERGYQAEFKVVKFDDNEGHTETGVEVEIRPAADYAVAPAAVEISS